MVPFVAACSQQSGTPTLTWYINPDNGGQKRLAEKCAPANGPYKVVIQTLPNSASDQREQLVRRLAAQDSSIDVMSLDPPYVAEFANAGFLKQFDKQDEAALTQGVLAGPLKTAYWGGKLVAAPFWGNTQLLWFRKAAVTAAGVDPTAPTFTWDQMTKAAVSQSKTVAVQANRYEGYMVWINALVASAGGEIITNVQAGKNATPAIDSPAGNAAAEVVGSLARSAAAPPAMSTATEEESRSVYQGDRGMFMVNWPYVYGAATKEASAGTISQSVVDDIGWARYPAYGCGPAQQAATGWHQPGHRGVHEVPRPGVGLGQVRDLAAKQHPVHGRLGEPRREGCGVRRSPGQEAVPHGPADPRLDQRRGAATDNAVLQRRVHVGADHLAPIRRMSGRRRHPRRAPPS